MTYHSPHDVLPLRKRHDEHTRGRKCQRDHSKRIAWTIDYRGDDDDVPSLMYIGAGYTMIKTVFMQMFGQPTGLFSGYSLYRYAYPYQKQQKAWERVVVEFRGYREDILSLKDLGITLQHAIHRQYVCDIKYLKLDKFINS